MKVAYGGHLAAPESFVRVLDTSENLKCHISSSRTCLRWGTICLSPVLGALNDLLQSAQVQWSRELQDTGKQGSQEEEGVGSLRSLDILDAADRKAELRNSAAAADILEGVTQGSIPCVGANGRGTPPVAIGPSAAEVCRVITVATR